MSIAFIISGIILGAVIGELIYKEHQIRKLENFLKNAEFKNDNKFDI